MKPSSPALDPRPLPPERPGRDECCHSGCDVCVYDLYDAAVERYRVELAAWEARQRTRRTRRVR